MSVSEVVQNPYRNGVRVLLRAGFGTNVVYADGWGKTEDLARQRANDMLSARIDRLIKALSVQLGIDTYVSIEVTESQMEQIWREYQIDVYEHGGSYLTPNDDPEFVEFLRSIGVQVPDGVVYAENLDLFYDGG